MKQITISAKKPDDHDKPSLSQNFGQWLLRGKSPVYLLLVLSLIATALLLLSDSRKPTPPWVVATPEDGFEGSRQPGFILFLYLVVGRYLVAWLACAIPAFVLAIVRRGGALPMRGVIAFCVSVILLALPRDIIENWAAITDRQSGELPSMAAYIWKLVLLGLALLSPVFLLWWHRKQIILERYVTRSFVVPLLFCLVGFIAIWLLMDLADQLAEFQKKNADLGKIIRIYVVKFPMLIVEVLPVALLLSTLYSLGRLSRSNELVAMLSSGRSMMSILKPYLVVGLVCSFYCLVLNYHWAPRADGLQKAIIESLDKADNREDRFSDHIYRNAKERRTWLIGSVPFELTEPFRNVQLIDENAAGFVTNVTQARLARWVRAQSYWVFAGGQSVTLGRGQEKERQRVFGTGPNDPKGKALQMGQLKESPWQILSSALIPDYLSVPELISYENGNREQATDQRLAPFKTHFWLRFAQPLKCFVLVLMAAPLGVIHSRRGFLGGIASCIFIFFGLLFLENLFVNLGKGAHLMPFLAAWTPYLAIGAIGSILLWFRATNREIPSLNPAKWFAALAKKSKTIPA